MLNYPVERAVLEPLVPAGTVLDTYRGQAYVSVVGFLFLKTKVLGLAMPFQQNFEEVNLRFYVRRFADGDWRRGVVFIKELVPKPAIAAVARWFYNENYAALPMRHAIQTDASGALTAVNYGWEHGGRWQGLQAMPTGAWCEAAPGSLAEFITEHYWGYVRQRDEGTIEYRVEHPRWRVGSVSEATLDCDAAALSGAEFADALSARPASAFVADGSAVTVFKGVRV